MAWSSAQQTALAVAPKVSSVLSLFGSGWIFVEVLWGNVSVHHGHSRNSNEPTLKRRHPYHRLLLAMSLYDILESIWNFASTWPLPADEPLDVGDFWQPVGTTQTCTAQGFFLTLSVAVPIYNAFLSLYYLLVINYRCSDTYIRKWIEPTMHIVSFLWAFGTAMISAATGMINNANLWCWIAPYPSNCLADDNDVECTRGKHALIFRWIFYFGPLWFCIFASTVFTLMVYWYVRNIDRKSLQYRSHKSSDAPRQMDADATATTTNGDGSSRIAGSRRSLLTRSRVSFLGASLQFGGSTFLGLQTMDNGNKDDDASANVHLSPCDNPPLDQSPSKPTVGARKQKFLERWKTPGQEEGTRANRRTVEVFHQALWYLFVFYATHVWSTSNRIIQQLNGGNTVYGLILMHSFFDPFQGALNYIVYQRPRYLRVRKDNPGMSRWTAVKRILRFSFLPQPETPSTEATDCAQQQPQIPSPSQSPKACSSMLSSASAIRPPNIFKASLLPTLETPCQEEGQGGESKDNNAHCGVLDGEDSLLPREGNDEGDNVTNDSNGSAIGMEDDANFAGQQDQVGNTLNEMSRVSPSNIEKH